MAQKSKLPTKPRSTLRIILDRCLAALRGVLLTACSALFAAMATLIAVALVSVAGAPIGGAGSFAPEWERIVFMLGFLVLSLCIWFVCGRLSWFEFLRACGREFPEEEK